MDQKNLMERLWYIPPREKRKPSHSFWQKGNVEFVEWIHEPDFYIIYRLGCVLRYISIFSALIVFGICCLHKYGDYFPDITNYSNPNNIIGCYLHSVSLLISYMSLGMDYPEQRNMLELYLYFINLSGLVFLMCFIYFSILLKKYANFSQYNILRQKIKTYKNCTKLQINGTIVFIIIGALFMFAPSSIAAFFYMDLHKGFFDQFFDSTGFVALVSVIIAFLHSVLTQATFKQLFVVLYIFYEKSLENKTIK